MSNTFSLNARVGGVVDLGACAPSDSRTLIFWGSVSLPHCLPKMAESTKEATEEGAKVTTMAEGTDATAAPPAEPGSKIVLTVFESLHEGKTLDDAKAAWAHVAEASAKTPGMRRFQSSWHEESKTAFVSEVFDNADCYKAFFGNLDVLMVTSIIKFDNVTLQCASHQVAAFGDLVGNLGAKVYLTDGCAGAGEIL